jgi:hypothetical protein
MLVELACFAAGSVAGGFLVFRRMRAAILKDLNKRPWTEEEKENRAQMLLEAATLSMEKDNPAAIQRSKELKRQLVNDDAATWRAPDQWHTCPNADTLSAISRAGDHRSNNFYR